MKKKRCDKLTMKKLIRASKFLDKQPIDKPVLVYIPTTGKIVEVR